MGVAVDEYKLTPKADEAPRQVHVDVVELRDIPGAMDNMGWKVAAKMMRQWFMNPLYVMPEKIREGKGIDYTKLPVSRVNDSILTMNWFLGFDRGKQAYEELRQTWKTPKALGVLRTRLLNHGWQPRTPGFRLGDGLNTAMELDIHCQVNRHILGEYEDTLDDLFGAVFKATLKIAVIGHTVYDRVADRDYFVVEKFGYYLRDTYDFNAEWYKDIPFSLGVWSKERCLSKVEMAEYETSWGLPVAGWLANGIKYCGFVGVRNADFRRYQEVNQSGGDFFVFSDVLWIRGFNEYVFIPKT